MGRRTLRKPVTRRTLRRSPDYRSVPPAAPEAQAAPVSVKTAPAAEDARGGTLRPPATAPDAPVVASKTTTLRPVATEPVQAAELSQPPPPADEEAAAPAADSPSTGAAEPAQAPPEQGPSASTQAGEHAFEEHTEGDAMHDAFFAVGESGYPSHDDDGAIPAVPMAHGTRIAMRVSLAMFVGFGIAIGGYLVYHKVVMPTPVAVGDTAPLSMDSFSPEPLQESEPLAAVDPPEETPPVASDGVVGDPRPATSSASATDVPEPVETQDAPQPTSESVPGTATAETVQGDLAGTVARLLEEAQRLQERGQNRPARAKFQAVLALSPDTSEAMSGIALIHLSAGKTKLALEFAQRAVTTDSQNAEGYIVLGAAKQALRDREGANEAYARCAELADPRYSLECRRLAH